ncbi:MAG TPA: PqiC family protein [Opitutaceae bacterium]|nr:PqiC family protein [Opitutaceae bacterium]
MRRSSSLPLLLAAALVAGCASHDHPTTYLTLEPVAPAESPAPASGTAALVAPVEIPPSLDRLLLTTATGAATLRVSGDARWSAPLADLIRQALARDLAQRLPGGRVLMPGDPVPPEGVRAVRVNIQEFRPDASGQVSLQAHWEVEAPHGGAVQRQGDFRIELPGAPQPGAEAATMSAAVGRLADAIAPALK